MLCTESGVYEADLLLEEGVIREIGTDLQDSGAEVVDAKGKYVLPGAVDIHTHMDLDVGIARVIDDFYTGTIAAACGGTTSIVDHMAFGPQSVAPGKGIPQTGRWKCSSRLWIPRCIPACEPTGPGRNGRDCKGRGDHQL